MNYSLTLTSRKEQRTANMRLAGRNAIPPPAASPRRQLLLY